MASSGGMGLSALTFAELDAYCNRTSTDLNAWESMQVINMSRDYCNWNNKGRDKLCQSPWNDSSEEAISANNDKIAAQMKALRNRNDN